MKLLDLENLKVSELEGQFDLSLKEHIELRQKAFTRFKELGLPLNKDEIFGKTGLRATYSGDYLKELSANSNWQIQENPNYKIVLRKGVYSPMHSSLPDGVKVQFEAEPHLYLDHKNPFYFLSYALNRGFYKIEIKRDLELDKPLEIIHTDEVHASQNHTHLSLHVKANAKVQILERVLVNSACFFNQTLAVYLDENAKIEHMHEQASHNFAHIISNYLYFQKKSSQASVYAYEHGSSLGISFWDLRLDEERAKLDFLALQTPTQKQHLSTIVELHHNGPNTHSTQLIKQTINDEAKGIVDAKVIVSKNGAGTKSHQLCNSLVLSEKAQVQSFVKPQLEIFIDDLEASHGATVGNLDEEQIYYLMSRGVDYESARKLLIEAFSQEVYKQFPKWAKEFISGG